MLRDVANICSHYVQVERVQSAEANTGLGLVGSSDEAERMTVEYETIQGDEALRRGLYSLTELTRYLNLRTEKTLSAATVARWARMGLTAVKHRRYRPDYSFADLISMFVVRNLVGLGLRLTEIRHTELFLRERFGHAHPFLSVRLKTDGVDVFYEASPGIAEQLTAANRWGQEVLRPAIFAALEGVTYDNAVAVAWTPISNVVLDPKIQFGEPCIAGTAVTTGHLAELANRSEINSADLARMYQLDENLVLIALRFEDRLTNVG